MKEATGGRAASGASAQRAGRLADAFGRAGKSVVRAFDDRLGEHGVSTPRSKLLAEVARMPEVGRKFDRWLDLVLVELVL